MFTAAGAFDWMVQGQTRGTHYMTVYNGDGTGLLERGPEWDPRMDTQATYLDLLEDPRRLTDVVSIHTVLNAGIGWRPPDGQLSLRGEEPVPYFSSGSGMTIGR